MKYDITYLQSSKKIYVRVFLNMFIITDEKRFNWFRYITYKIKKPIQMIETHTFNRNLNVCVFLDFILRDDDIVETVPRWSMRKCKLISLSGTR